MQGRGEVPVVWQTAGEAKFAQKINIMDQEKCMFYTEKFLSY
jgi:hypothetical protein